MDAGMRGRAIERRSAGTLPQGCLLRPARRLPRKTLKRGIMPSAPRKPASPKRENILDVDRVVLSGADREAFLAALEREPDPSKRLVEALKRHRHLFV
jgi:uncharacterized protein (DUF1778 family)